MVLLSMEGHGSSAEALRRHTISLTARCLIKHHLAGWLLPTDTLLQGPSCAHGGALGGRRHGGSAPAPDHQAQGVHWAGVPGRCPAGEWLGELGSWWVEEKTQAGCRIETSKQKAVACIGSGRDSAASAWQQLLV
jgi:hypothetical protein